MRVLNRTGSNRGKKFPPSPVSPDEVRRMMAVCTKGDLGVRNRAMLLTLQRTGVRVSELVRLRPGDATDDVLRVVGGKGSKSRLVGLDPTTADAIAQWTNRRTAQGIGVGHHLFCSLAGERLSTNGVRELLKRLARRAGIESRVTPHQFRHGFAVYLAKSGVVRLDEIQAALAHESLHTTQRYLAGLGGETAIQAVSRVAWGD